MVHVIVGGIVGVAIAAFWAAWRDAARARRDDDATEAARRKLRLDKS